MTIPDNSGGPVDPSYKGAGAVDVNFLTGQGRDLGELLAIVNHVVLQDDLGPEDTKLQAEVTLRLKGFQSQIVHLDVRPGGRDSRLFQNYPLEVLRFEQDNGGGFSTLPAATTDLSPDERGFPATFPARIRVFPGRDTSLPVFFDDSMVTIEQDGQVYLNAPQFEAINMPANNPQLLAFISDYVMFDISGMADGDKPILSSGDPAGRIYFSGDNIAISQGGQFSNPPGPDRGIFEALTLDVNNPISGFYGPQQNLGTGSSPGTYSLVTPDPTDLTGTARITSLQGIWRPFSQVVSDSTGFVFLTMPTSDDNGDQDVVLVQHSGDKVTNMYFGFADLEAGTFRVYPIKDVVSGITAGELTGTVSSYVTASGTPTAVPHQVRIGAFTFDPGSSLPSGFPNTGAFLVFRR